MISLVLLQAIVLVCLIAITGVINEINTASYDTLSKYSNSRKKEIQNYMQSLSFSLLNEAKLINNIIDEELTKNNLDYEQLASGGENSQNVLSEVLKEMCDFTKLNTVTGMFVIFDSNEKTVIENDEKRTAIYIRDSSPEAYHKNNNNNLLLEYGSIIVARKNEISVDYLWTEKMDFFQNSSTDYFDNPVKEALTVNKLERQEVNIQNYGYWSKPFQLKPDDVRIITYSIPLINSNGEVYCLLGLELQLDYIMNLLPYSEIPFDLGSYLLLIDKGEGLLSDNTISNGPFSKQFLAGSNAELDFSLLDEENGNEMYKVKNSNFPKEKVLGTLNEIILYDENSSFHDNRWFISCIVPLNSIQANSDNVINAMIISILLSVVFATLFSLIATNKIINPVRLLLNKINRADPVLPIRFEETKVDDIDQLANAFETLTDKVSVAASRMFNIIELLDMPLGSFEISSDKKQARISKTMYKLMDIPLPENNLYQLSIEQWESFMSLLGKRVTYSNEEGITESTYTKVYKSNLEKWLKIRQFEENNHCYGVVMDVTEEVMQKQRLEFERNYDNLTKLLNRNAFNRKIEELIRSFPNKTGFLMFSDLDDLKFLNDTYGHDIGDIYIKKYADFLICFKEAGGVVCRLSGDEFAVYMHGFDSKEEAKRFFHKMFNEINSVCIIISEEYTHKMRVSVGLSFYPHDATDPTELLKYADYAMYEIKKSIKGDIREFNLNSYEKNSFVLNMKNILNFLIEEKRLKYAFQPIVDVKTGEVFAYEALMRSTVREFNSPDQILKVAQVQ